MKLKIKHFFYIAMLIIHLSCGFKVSTIGANSSDVISGIITPFAGLISQNSSISFLFSDAVALNCAYPVYAKLYKINNDGAIDDSNPLASQLVGADAIYSFDLKSLNIQTLNSNVQFLVKAEGCNGAVYKRPVTNIDNRQNLDAKTTVIADVVNANRLVSTKLNEADRKQVENLINSISGTSANSVVTSLTTDSKIVSQFTQIFGTSPTAIQDAHPEVTLIQSQLILNELQSTTFSVQAFHIDPNYSFAFKWKIDGVVKSSSSTLNYIPGANDQGAHQIDIYVGKDDGAGNIDLTKPYYTKTLSVSVNNNVLPQAPLFSLNVANPSPVNSTTIQVDLATGVSFANCASFSHLAITDTANAPGIMQFNINCTASGTQTESVTYSSGDGEKTLYLWAIDAEGNVSAPKTISLVLDTQPPVASLGIFPSIVQGGSPLNLPLSANDAGVGLLSVDLYFSSNGGTSYTLLSHLSNTATAYNWSVPLINTTNAKFKLVATDLTSSSTTVSSSAFEIDSTAPTAPTITSSAFSNSRTIVINTTCSNDYNKILYSENNTAPLVSDAGWEICANTKNFTVTSGDGQKTISAFTKDAAGNISSSSSVTLTLDTTPPNAPVANLASANISNSTTVSFTIPDCTDRPSILISESPIAPAVNDSHWQTCSVGVGAITHILIGPVLEQAHTLYVYAKDAVGNISLPTSVSMIYDTTNPTLNLSTVLGTIYKGGDTIALNFSASDTNGLSSLKLYYTNDGTTYSLVSNLATSATSYTWTVPSDNTTTAKLKLVASDNATSLNSSTVYSTSFTIDSTPPNAPALTRTSSALSNSATVTMTIGNCVDTAYILISETNSQPAVNDSNWQLCSTVAGNYSATVTGDGTHTFYAWAKDLAANRSASASSITMTYDSTAPVIAVTTPSAMQGNVSTGSVSWTLTETNLAAGTNFLVEIFNGSSWSTIGSVPGNAGVNTNQAYSLANFSVPNVDTLSAKFRVTITDAVGLQAQTQSNPFTIASTVPSIGTFQINGGAATTTSSYVSLALSATSPIVNMTQFCFKLSASTPALNDACWTPLNAPQPNVTPSLSINFSNYNYLLSFTPGPYTIYGWVKDSVGNISNSVSSSIVVQTPTPPTVGNILVANSSSPSDPVLSSDKTFNGSQPAYIKWKVTAATTATITLSYQTNSGTTVIASGLINGSNGGCTVNDITTADDQDTGCYVWNGAPSQYFTVTVKATDNNNVSAQSTSYPLNAPLINFLAGKTDLGLGSSAINAILKIASSWTDVGSLVVTTDGRIFLRDRSLGLVMVDPKDGILKQVMPITGTSSGDGGSVANATLCGAQKIALDFQDRVLIFDCTKIRRIDTAANPMTISTIIGGGATQADATPALSFQIVNPGTADGGTSPKTIPFFALPNGDIYFQSSSYTTSIGAGYRIRKYQASDNKVYMITPSGIGTSEDPAVDITTLQAYGFGVVYNPLNSQISNSLLQIYKAYTGDNGFSYINLDPTTFVSTAPHPMKSGRNDYYIQGMNGKLYVHDGRSALLRSFNEATGTFTTLVGGGTNTACPDGTLATQCKVNNGSSGFDAFISAKGQIYFVDYFGIVRTVLADGTVRKIMGQSKGAGDGGLATEARANAVNWVDQANDGTIFFSDDTETRIRKFTIDGDISAHASIQSEPGFVLNPVTKDIYARSGNTASKLTFTTALWSNIGTISTTFNSVANNASQIFGYDGSSSLFYGIQPAWDATLGYHDYKLANFNWSTPAVTVLTNYTGSTSTYCANNTSASACSVSPSGNARAQYDTLPTTPRWIMLKSGTTRIVALNKDGMNTNEVMLDVATLPRNAVSFVYRKVAGADIVDYCASNGLLYSYNITTSTDTAYSWPITTLTCAGNTLNFNSTRNSLIFPARQNGLSAVVEYKLSP